MVTRTPRLGTPLPSPLRVDAASIPRARSRTCFVRVKHRLSADILRLGTTAALTADEVRAMAVAEIEPGEAERKTGPLFRYFAEEFMRRLGFGMGIPAVRTPGPARPRQAPRVAEKICPVPR